MGCGCNKARGAVGGGTGSGTFRVIVSGRQVYESSSPEAADAVAGRFAPGVAKILKPGEAA